MEQLKMIKETLINQVQGQMGNLEHVHTKELGEVIDMIKDLSEASYYCSIVEAMEDKNEKDSQIPTNNNYYYTERYLPADDYREGMMYYPHGKRYGGYYTEGSNTSTTTSSNMNGNMRNYTEEYSRDQREGRSPMKRRMYMEAKETHQSSAKKIKELESYLQDLTSDVMEMIKDASPEEKAILQKKMNVLAEKLDNV